MDVEAVANEMAKAFRATGMSEAQVSRWQAAISTNASPEQQKGILQEGVSLLSSRLDSLAEKYNKGMGTTADPMTLLTPKTQAIFKKFGGGESAAAPSKPGTVLRFDKNGNPL
jgi:hypothetical protein